MTLADFLNTAINCTQSRYNGGELKKHHRVCTAKHGTNPRELLKDLYHKPVSCTNGFTH